MKQSQYHAKHDVWPLMQNLQLYFESLLKSADPDQRTNFERIDWLRNSGENGGGWRMVARKDGAFNSASINISHVYYEKLPDKDLNSAISLSTIVHPNNPLAPSVHMHFSWTSLKNGRNYWRLMADLNPSIEFTEDKVLFENTFKEIAKDQYIEAMKQGNIYFTIPELNRTRGISHFYLENYNSGDSNKDFKLTQDLANGMLKVYSEILSADLLKRKNYSIENQTNQLDYHTIYLFQVLTLDRGTSTGLLAHNQNDLGIMGSLPRKINRKKLVSLLDKVDKTREQLLKNILHSIPESGDINNETKLKLAATVRAHYCKSL